MTRYQGSPPFALWWLLVVAACDTREEIRVDEQWDYYLCKVDDAPASIFVNLGLAAHVPLVGEDSLYATRIAMLDPGKHGMGTAEEGEVLYPAANLIESRAQELGLRPVGRVRNNGTWQLTFMGAADNEEQLARIVDDTLSVSGREYDHVVRPDPGWSYYLEFLYPDDERMQWIQNRRLVDKLQELGDPLTEKRRVDHWVYFGEPQDRTAFAHAARAQGFACEVTERGCGTQPFSLQAHRVDSVELDAIHEVVMVLHDLAVRHGGDYDGWETAVEKPR